MKECQECKLTFCTSHFRNLCWHKGDNGCNCGLGTDHGRYTCFKCAQEVCYIFMHNNTSPFEELCWTCSPPKDDTQDKVLQALYKYYQEKFQTSKT